MFYSHSTQKTGLWYDTPHEAVAVADESANVVSQREGETKVGLEESVSYSAAPRGAADAAQVTERRIIREQFLEQQVEDLQAALSRIEEEVGHTPGSYIESWEEWKTERRQQIEHRASVVIRVPTESFPTFFG
jgi:hypothetical protein